MFNSLVRFLVLSVMLVVPVVETGCSARRSPVVGSPTAVRDLHITQSIAILVEANNAAAKTVIQLNKVGTLDQATTAEILSYIDLVAKTSKNSLVILNSDQSIAAKSSAVLSSFMQVTSHEGIKAFMDKSLTDPKFRVLVASIQTIQLIAGNVVDDVVK